MTDDDGLRVVGHLLDRHGTTGKYARDERGIACQPTYRGAACWCMVGACELVSRRVLKRQLWDRSLAVRACERLGIPLTDHRWSRAALVVALEHAWDDALPERRQEMLAMLKSTGVES